MKTKAERREELQGMFHERKIKELFSLFVDVQARHTGEIKHPPVDFPASEAIAQILRWEYPDNSD